MSDPVGRRWALLALGALAACAPLETETATTASSSARPPPGVLSPWVILTGGWLASSPPAPPAPGAPAPPLTAPRATITPPLQRLNFQMPVGVAANGNLVLIADAGWRQLFRLERGRDQMIGLGPWANALAADHATGLQITRDGSVWLADPAGARVVQIDASGRTRQQLRDDRYATRPIAVFASGAPGDIYVADATDARIVVFEPFGRVIRRLGADRLQSIAAMVDGPLGLYVVDRLAQQVVVFDFDGRVRTTFGEDSLVQPRAIAVDREGRVFVGDDADAMIKVFVDGERVAQAGGRAAGPMRFDRIDSLAIDGNLLYVADSTSARVHVLLVSPESMRRPGSR